MLEDLRNHDASPTEEEAEWVATGAVSLILRAVAMASVALLVGVAASVLLEGGGFTPGLVAAAEK